MRSVIFSLIAAAVSISSNVDASQYHTTLHCYTLGREAHEIVYYDDFSKQQSVYLPESLSSRNWYCTRDMPYWGDGFVDVGFHCWIRTNPSAPYVVYVKTTCNTYRSDNNTSTAYTNSYVDVEGITFVAFCATINN